MHTHTYTQTRINASITQIHTHIPHTQIYTYIQAHIYTLLVKRNFYQSPSQMMIWSNAILLHDMIKQEVLKMSLLLTLLAYKDDLFVYQKTATQTCCDLIFEPWRRSHEKIMWEQTFYLHTVYWQVYISIIWVNSQIILLNSTFYNRISFYLWAKLKYLFPLDLIKYANHICATFLYLGCFKICKKIILFNINIT